VCTKQATAANNNRGTEEGRQDGRGRCGRERAAAACARHLRGTTAVRRVQSTPAAASAAAAAMGAAAGSPGCAAPRHGRPAAVATAGPGAAPWLGCPPPGDGRPPPWRTPHGMGPTGGAAARGRPAWVWGAAAGKTPAGAPRCHPAAPHSLPRKPAGGRHNRTDCYRLCPGAPFIFLRITVSVHVSAAPCFRASDYCAAPPQSLRP
jgi:hypothetical protein